MKQFVLENRQAADSYLNIPHIMAAAEITNADAIHPGLWFSWQRMQSLHRSATIMVSNLLGPLPDMINSMGDKITAKETMIKAGVPVIPGGEGLLESLEEAKALAAEVWVILLFLKQRPVAVEKVCAWFGKKVKWKELIILPKQKLLLLLKMMAFTWRNSWKSHGILKYRLPATSYGTVCHLSESDCSIQRRHQKLVEESPSPFMTPELRIKWVKPP